ncbi:MAG: DUF2314 domain-containing protein [Opitutaceae bacterium]
MQLRRGIRNILVALCVIALTSCKPDLPVGITAEDTNEDTLAFDQIVKLKGKVTFTLENAEALNRKHPGTFWIPPRELRENLVKDDLVKLVFNLSDENQRQAERMWVRVKSGDNSGYTGILDNDPYCTDQIKAGLEVLFKPQNVIDIYEIESLENKEAP